jgi:hypothetical protein
MIERARLAVVVGDGMDDATLATVGEACARLGAGVHVWSGPRAPEPPGAPALIVAALDAGARQLPDELVELADRRFPGTELLLLCNEPLVRPTLTLQHGRLTLMAPPATVERTASRIRLLLTLDDVAPHAAPEPGAVRGRELRRAGWWAADLAAAGRDGDAAPVRPWIGCDRGLTTLLADGGLPDGAAEEAAALLGQHGGDDDERRAGLARLLGDRAGVVHLSADGPSWLVYWPCARRPLWLFSTQRLPRWSDLGRHGDAGLWRIPAVAGDVIAGLSSAEGFADGGAALPATEVSAAMLDGGPALLALFEARLAAAPRPFSCVLAEVR